MNLFDLLDKSARRYPRNAAVCHGETVVHDYGRLKDRASRLAGALAERAATGDRVAIVSANAPEYVEILFACWAAGLVVVPVNAKLHPREIGEIFEDAVPKVVFVSAKIRATLGAHAGSAHVIEIASTQYDEWVSGAALAPFGVGADDLAWLFYTSGTTGRSKGAMLSHRNLHAMAVSYLADFDCVEPGHSLIHAAPMSHGSGLYIVPYVLRAARQVVPLSGGFDPAEFVALASSHPDCAVFLAPTMVQRLRLEIERTGVRPASLRTVVYGGGPMYLDELTRSLEILGPVLVQLYGQGEAPMTITGLRRGDHMARDTAVLGSVGWPRTGVEVAVVDHEDQPLEPGETGEIVCRGDVVMLGYWRSPAASAAALRGGWLHTGDVGAFDLDGKLTLRDRSKDVIISGGSNIYPREVEEVLIQHPAVREACVVGQRDDEWGEIVVAFVVAEPGADLDQSELDQHALTRIARFKRPKRYHFVSALPKSNYGKILRRELAAGLTSDN